MFGARSVAMEGGIPMGDRLDLSHHLIGDKGMLVVGKVLGSWPALTTLVLRGNGIRDEAALVLAAALRGRKLPKIANIDLSDNQVRSIDTTLCLEVRYCRLSVPRHTRLRCLFARGFTFMISTASCFAAAPDFKRGRRRTREARRMHTDPSARQPRQQPLDQRGRESDGAESASFCAVSVFKNDHFTKTGSRQT
jgi:hypothetical protein